jgi:hypothetical protein
MLYKLAQRARPQTKPAAADLGADRGRPSDTLAARARPHAWPALTALAPHAWPALTGLILGLLALGPALGSGFVLSYDMVFVPAPPVGYADLGLGGGPPRAVPSDLVVALAAKIIPAEFVQKLILIAIFVLACSGAAALLAARWPERVAGRRLPLLAQLVAGVCYAWNPFVAERLIMGQWAMLLGYAGLPWVVREVVGGRAGRIRLWGLAAAIVPATIGGFAAMSITVLAAVPAAICGGHPWPVRARRLLLTFGVLAVASLPWLIPSLINPVHADPNGATTFAARADTPFGAFGSLLMLSGIWNAEAVPSGYGGAASACWLAVVVLAGAGYLVAARGRRISPGAGVAGVAGFCIAAIGLTAPTLTALRAAIGFWPGFALLRDGQQFVAPTALALAIGLGAGVGAMIEAARAPGGSRLIRGPRSPAGPVATLGVLALAAPVILLPGLAWGAVGRLQAVQYPADWIRARQLIDGDRHAGSALLLPWAQYRRYPWNHGEAVFDPWPRLLARPMIWNDALQVGRTTVAPESERARQLSPLIASAGPMTSALAKAGVRYVVIDAGPLLRRDRQDPGRLALLARLPGAQLVLAGPDLVVFRLPASP